MSEQSNKISLLEFRGMLKQIGRMMMTDGVEKKVIYEREVMEALADYTQVNCTGIRNALNNWKESRQAGVAFKVKFVRDNSGNNYYEIAMIDAKDAAKRRGKSAQPKQVATIDIIIAAIPDVTHLSGEQLKGAIVAMEMLRQNLLKLTNQENEQ